MGISLEADIAEVRSFNRFWTRQLGLLGAGLVDTPYSLTEARLLFELAQAERTDVAELRRRLRLDSGHLSRLLARFRTDGLLVTEPSAFDGRRLVASLTDRGRDAFALLDERAAAQIADQLGPLSDGDRRRVVESMAAIRDALETDRPVTGYALRGLRPGDLGWVIQRNATVYAGEHGWDDSYEHLVARIVADFAATSDNPRQDAWIADIDGDPVGCVFCVRRDDDTAQLRLLLVDPAARGLGIGRRLVDECVRFARRAGYRRIVLWTNDVLTSARPIYEAAGFVLDAEEPHHSFGRDLVGQTWSLDLDRGADAPRAAPRRGPSG
jgi:DNA-binding MarR family transcriptional regulator/GNAT superfamily N-acetyltransferase